VSPEAAKPASDELRLAIQQSIYPIPAIHAACFAFLDRAYIFLSTETNGDVRIRLRPKAAGAPEEFESLAGEFQNELLHHALRLKVSASNAGIRSLILARAFRSAAGVGPLEPGADETVDAVRVEAQAVSADSDPLYRSAQAAGGGPDRPSPIPPSDPLEKQIERLFDHAERDSRSSDLEGEPIDWAGLSRKVGRG
jgi:His-Xaa-Ser system protein HxsD